MAVDPARAKSLFLGASALASPAERAVYLDRECGTDAELRARVEALLAAQDAADRDRGRDAIGIPESLSGATHDVTSDSTSGTLPPTGMVTGERRPDVPAATCADTPPADRGGGFISGQVIAGRYALRDVLGEGGMGTVYRADQTEPVKRQVALKLIRIGMDSRAVVARFDAERQALALMDHPNIARVFDGGNTEAGQPYFVMELVKGTPITEYCDRRWLPLRARLELFVAVAQAVQHAHQKGIIHRDLKPSNVLVTEVDGRPVPKVIDFGVSKATGFDLTDQSLGDTGAIVGTPTYMSPEQADPESMDVDTRTDVYALGVILYELLTGSPPIDAKQFKRGAFLEMLRMVRELDPPRPSTRVSAADALPNIAASRDIEPAQLKRALRGDLDWIVMKALEKDRTRRYETANGLAADVLRHLAGEPVVAAPPSRAYRLRKFVRKHRGSVLAASLVLLALLGGIAGTTWGLFEARRQEQIARDEALAKETARASEAAARGRAQALATKEAKARGEAQEQERIALEKAEQLAREDYVNRVNRAYREVQDDNVAMAEDLLHGCDPKRRGWEWNYVERLCNSERLTLDLGNASVNALAFGPDGSWAVSAAGALIIGGTSESETTVDVWDTATGRRRRTLPGAKDTAYSVAVGPDGQRVAVGCSQGLVLVWDTATGQIAWTRSKPPLNAMSVAFSPDGKTLAVGYGYYSGDVVGRVEIRGVESGEEIKSFLGPLGGVNEVAFHPGGKRLAVAGSGVVEIWDLDTATKVRDLKGHAKWVYGVAFSPDGKTLATGGWDRTVRLWDVDTGAARSTLFAHEGFVLDLAFSPDGHQLATASEDRSLKLWDVPSGRLLAAFHGHTDFLQAVAFRPGGREVTTGSLDGSLRFWDLRTSRPVVFEHTGWVWRLAVRRDGLRVLSDSGDFRTAEDNTKGWNPLTGELDPALGGPPLDSPPYGFVAGAEFQPATVSSPVGKLVAQISPTGGTGGASRSREHATSAVVIRDVTTGQVVHTLTGHSADVVSAMFSPDGRRLATASFDRTVKLWDTATGQDVFTLRGHTAGVVCLAFSPDGNLLISGSIDSTARVWNATPLPSEAIAEHDARYEKKITMLAQLKAATDDIQRAQILASSGQWVMAAIAFGKAIQREPNKLPLRYRHILALAEAGNSSSLRLACADMLKTFGDAADPMQNVAITEFCRLARESVAEPQKLSAIRQLVSADNDEQRAWILVRHGQWKAVSASLGKLLALEQDPISPERSLELAYLMSDSKWILHDAGRFDEAADAARGALGLVNRLERKGQLDVPSRVFLLLDQGCFLGEILARRGRRGEALEEFQRQRQLIQTSRTNQEYQRPYNAFDGAGRLVDYLWCLDAFCLASMGRLQAEMGQHDDARKSLEEARKILRSVVHDKVVFPRVESLAIGQTLGLMNQLLPEATDDEPTERRRLIDHAMAALRQLVAAGYKHVEYLKESPSYEVLRRRTDYQLLVQDLAFPPRPFEDDPP